MAGDAKPTRADEVRRERRRKPGAVSNPGIHLAVEETRLDRTRFQYRWVREDRVQRLEAQDWDRAPETGAKPDSNSVGTVASAHGGTDAGKPYDMVLMRKHKDWFETDQKEKQKPLDEMEKAIKRGNTAHRGNQLHGPGVYTPGADEFNPSGVNIIETAR